MPKEEEKGTQRENNHIFDGSSSFLSSRHLLSCVKVTSRIRHPSLATITFVGLVRLASVGISNVINLLPFWRRPLVLMVFNVQILLPLLQAVPPGTTQRPADPFHRPRNRPAPSDATGTYI